MEKQPWTELEKFADALDFYHNTHLNQLSPHEADFQSDISIQARTLACRLHTDHLQQETNKLRVHSITSALLLLSRGEG
jgi:hypothetical protein